MIIGKPFAKLLYVLAGVFAMATLTLMLVWYINKTVGEFMPVSGVRTLERFRDYFTLASIFCSGMAFTLRRNLIVAIVFAAIVVSVAIFMIVYNVTAI